MNAASARGRRKASPVRHVAFTVANIGTGIPPEILDRILDPSFTNKPKGKGTSPGLAALLDIVENHRGQSETMRRGARRFLSKPFDAERLLAALSSALETGSAG